jgi:hypothetical protein
MCKNNQIFNINLKFGVETLVFLLALQLYRDSPFSAAYKPQQMWSFPDLERFSPQNLKKIPFLKFFENIFSIFFKHVMHIKFSTCQYSTEYLVSSHSTFLVQMKTSKSNSEIN